MIITDADAAMTSAIADVLPNAAHLHCSWHIMNNLKKNCTGAMNGKYPELVRRYKAAAFATSGNVSCLAWPAPFQHFLIMLFFNVFRFSSTRPTWRHSHSPMYTMDRRLKQFGTRLKFSSRAPSVKDILRATFTSELAKQLSGMQRLDVPGACRPM